MSIENLLCVYKAAQSYIFSATHHTQEELEDEILFALENAHKELRSIVALAARNLSIEETKRFKILCEDFEEGFGIQ